MQAVILAGGLGTRIQSIHSGRPKALIPVLGRAFLSYQMDWLVSQQVTEVVIAIGYCGEQIEEFVRQHAPWKIPVVLVNEGENLLGTGGALRLAYEQSRLDKEFVLIYGDSYLQLNVLEAFQAYQNSNRSALMCVSRCQDQLHPNNVKYCDGQVILYDKFHQHIPADHMDYIDYGLSIIRSDLILQKIPTGVKCDLAHFFNEISMEGQLAGFEVHERFYEVGSRQGLADFEGFVATHKMNFEKIVSHR